MTSAVRNAEIDWDKFHSQAYCDRNYLVLRDDDREIATTLRDFFVEASAGPGARGLDVGAGSNLYPSLAMLPFCDRVDLWEFSAANVWWLRRQRWLGFDRRWDSFWRIYCEEPSYAGRNPRREFVRKARVRRRSIFALPQHTWDIGTMFFVACSLSTERVEFDAAVRSFVGALKPQAPFAAAFMVRSTGYPVADRWFPSTYVERSDVDTALNALADDVKLLPIGSDNPLRPGVGMLLATGRAKST